MARNVLRGGGAANKVAVEGLKGLERKLKALSRENPELKFAMQQTVAAGAKEMRDEMRAQARAAGWGSQAAWPVPGFPRWKPHGKNVAGSEALQSIFSYGRPKPSENRWQRISALAGVTRKATMVEWRAGAKNRPALPGRERKKNRGELVAMSLATMLEYGTTNRPPRPAIRTAIKSARARIVDAVATSWKSLLDRFSK